MAQLEDLFRSHAVVKILDFFTMYPEFEYTKTDVIKETGISRRTLYQVWPTLERFNLITMTKSAGLIKFYKMNRKSTISKRLIELADQISFFEARKTEGFVPTSILQTELQSSASSDVVEKLNDETTAKVSVITMIKAEVPSSEVAEIIQRVSEIKDREIKVKIQASTANENTTTTSKKRIITPLSSQINET
ncbi:hypothetical protein KAU88_10150 [Candidatus Bathyarchaeota archaeon]|nr:hypothetical protein [Candidatus Bathyarchaeota archaeon]